MDATQIAGSDGATSYETLAARAAAAPPPQPRDPLLYLMSLLRNPDFAQHLFLDSGAQWPPPSHGGGAVNEVTVVDPSGAYVSLAEMAQRAGQAPATMLQGILGGPNQDRLAVHVLFSNLASVFGGAPQQLLETLAAKHPEAIIYREGGPPTAA
jgi:hypothetical protein